MWHYRSKRAVAHPGKPEFPGSNGHARKLLFAGDHSVSFFLKIVLGALSNGRRSPRPVHYRRRIFLLFAALSASGREAKFPMMNWAGNWV
jgi:hypothetical protein